MKNPLFTIILLYYNQKKYIFEALNSIFNQNYDNIELIICDDGSDLDIIEIKNCLNIHFHNHNIKFILNERNIGTVKTVNKALKISTGEYVLIFAADDVLYDKNVLTNFSKEFLENPDRYIISSQCLLYDNKLDNLFGKYVNESIALDLNGKEAIDQYKCLCHQCLYAAGATAYKSSLFLKTDYIPENFKLVEDLSYWLFLTRNNYKIFFTDFIGLNHRDGGVSKSEFLDFKVPKHVLDYYEDILKIKETIILPSLKIFNFDEKVEIIDNYKDYLVFISRYFKKINYNILRKVYILNPRYFFIVLFRKARRFLSKIKHFIVKIKHCIVNILTRFYKMLIRFYKILPSFCKILTRFYEFFNYSLFRIFVWTCLNLILLFFENINNSFLLVLFYYIFTYFLSILIVKILNKIRRLV